MIAERGVRPTAAPAVLERRRLRAGRGDRRDRAGGGDGLHRRGRDRDRQALCGTARRSSATATPNCPPRSPISRPRSWSTATPRSRAGAENAFGYPVLTRADPARAARSRSARRSGSEGVTDAPRSDDPDWLAVARRPALAQRIARPRRRRRRAASLARSSTASARSCRGAWSTIPIRTRRSTASSSSTATRTARPTRTATRSWSASAAAPPNSSASPRNCAPARSSPNMRASR